MNEKNEILAQNLEKISRAAKIVGKDIVHFCSYLPKPPAHKTKSGGKYTGAQDKTRWEKH